MIKLGIIVLLVLFLFAFNKDKLSPNSFFLGLWFVVVLLYDLHLFEIYSISSYTWTVLFFGLIAFEAGYLLNERFILTSYSKKSTSNSNSNSSVNVSLINILILIAFFSSLPTGFYRIKFLISNGFDVGAVKNALIIGKLPSGTILDTFIVSPLSPLITYISTYYLINSPKNKIISFSGIYFTLYYYFISGARLSILYYIIALFINLRISGKSFDLIPVKIKKWILRIIIPLLVLLVYLMTKNTENGLKNIYYYLCGCVPMLDHVVNRQFGYFDLGRTNGTLSFYGIVNPFCQILSRFGFKELGNVCQIAENYLANIELPNYAGADRMYNAFVTYTASFYIDFGLLGVIVLSFVFGFFSSHYYKEYIQKNSLYDALPIGVIYVFVLTSIIKFGFTGYRFGLGYLYILGLRKVLFKKNDSNDRQ